MRMLVCAAAVSWIAAAAVLPLTAQQPAAAPAAAVASAAGAPAYTASGELIRPRDYREWVFLSSGLGMTYGPAQAAQSAARAPMFDNVFVTRAAYRAFMNTGRWPDKTVFILEIRRSLENASINNGGRTQGDVAFIEAAVKDVQRFKDTGGWAYFNFGGGDRLADSVAPLAASASCYNCHATNTAVENTFVQFYPDLFAAARKHGTVKREYQAESKK